MPRLTPLQRIRKALDECGHPRGVCGKPAEIEIGEDDDGNPVTVPGIRNPLVNVLAADVLEVCELVPVENRKRVVVDLRRGSQRASKREDGTIDPLLEVGIQVDDAWTLIEAAGKGLQEMPPLADPPQLEVGEVPAETPPEQPPEPEASADG